MVLIVDDDDDSREIMVSALQHHGFHALAAHDGSEALLAFDGAEEAWPDVIVLDLAMPVMDGHEFLAARAERPEIASVPAVVISGATADRDLASSVWNEYLPKPVTLHALVDAITRCASFRRRPPGH